MQLFVLRDGVLGLKLGSELLDSCFVSFDRLRSLLIDSDAIHGAETVLSRVLVTPVERAAPARVHSFFEPVQTLSSF